MPIVAVSCSWMWSYFNNNQVFETALRDINDNGRNGRGVHIVFCSMNDNDEKIPYPAKLDFCIAVGGSNLLDDRYHFGSIDGSNYGPDLEMVAPATDLESTDNTLNYGGTTGYVYRITGTSYSAPQVAAALGLMYSYNRTLRHSDALYNLLHYGVDKVGGNYNQNHTYGSWDYEMGYGRLNLVKCVNYIEHIPYSICINENITIGLGQNAIYAAFHSITLPCDNPYTFSVLSGGICLLASGNSIILNPGFSAADGSTFFAYIEPSYNLNKTNTQIYQPSFYLSNYLTEKSLKKELVPQYFLNQNYPNPFNPLTSIKYSIEMEGNVTIKVYDILGRLVATLVNEYKKAGIYDIQFDGTNFASGLYIYQIKSGNFVSNKKMVLVK
jgi:hypothetical protein